MRALASAAVAMGLLSSQVRSEPLPARDDAFTPARGTWQVGVFNPARHALTDDITIEAHPLIVFVAPHATALVRHVQLGDWQLTGSYGLSLPSLAMRLLQGYLFPSYEQGGGSLGFHLVPSLGLLASRGQPDTDVLTVKLDAAVGVPLAAGDARPLQAPAPLDLVFAPVLNGYRVRLGALYDARLDDRARLRIYADAFAHGIDESNTRGHLARFTFRVGGGFDLRVGAAARLCLGVVVWNGFQHARDEQGRDLRSTDPLPVLDFIWTR